MDTRKMEKATMMKTGKTNGKPAAKTRKERKSGSGVSGSPKKGGHGGKFTWSGADNYSAVELGSEVAVDSKDPKFEDPTEDVVV